MSNKNLTKPSNYLSFDILPIILKFNHKLSLKKENCSCFMLFTKFNKFETIKCGINHNY